MSYNHKEIEAKWQKYWLENKTFKTDVHSDKEKIYVLDMFPYPSGSGLHVGHPEGYTATDIISRMKECKDTKYYTLWVGMHSDLPAEQYALDTGNSPQNYTEKYR